MERSNVPLVVIATVAVIFLLDFAAAFFVPLLLALLISNALTPIVGGLTAVIRWRPLAAGIVVLACIGLTSLGAYAWADDVQMLWQEVPAAARTLSKSLQKVVQKPAAPINEMKKAADDLQSMAQTGRPAPKIAPPAAPAATPIDFWTVLWTGWKTVMSAGGAVMVVSFLVFFMLASGDLFKRKLLAIAAERNKRRLSLQVMEEIDLQIRRYLVVLLISNVLVGLGTWAVFAVLGVNHAGLWGLVAGVLHTVPYFGPGIIAGGSFVAAFVQFEDWPKAFLASGASILVATLVGQLWATWFASKQTRMNPTATFIGLLFFGWIWGLWGILLGIPILVIVKTICERNDNWKPVAELLGQ